MEKATKQRTRPRTASPSGSANAFRLLKSHLEPPWYPFDEDYENHIIIAHLDTPYRLWRGCISVDDDGLRVNICVGRLREPEKWMLHMLLRQHDLPAGIRLALGPKEHVVTIQASIPLGCYSGDLSLLNQLTENLHKTIVNIVPQLIPFDTQGF